MDTIRQQLSALMRVLFVLAATAALCIEAYFFGIPGLCASSWGLTSAKGRIQAKLDRLKAQNNVVEKFNKVSAPFAEIPALEKEVEILNTIVPDGRNEAQFESSVREVASSAGVKIRKIEPGLPIREHSFYTSLVLVRLQADQESLSRFLRNLMKLSRIANVSMLYLDPLNSGFLTFAGGDRLDAECMITIYFLGQQTVPAE
jgi:Tfp pilus assembly protein PilO